MGRIRRRRDENYQEFGNSADQQYNMAYKRVKRIKSFYVHALVYVLVNTVIIISRSNRDLFNAIEFWSWETWSTALFWGMGLLAHGFSVFGRDLFFGSDWEEKKIQQFMDKDKGDKWE
ncbi:2TM domain-containing protein [Flavobacterium frigoris]|uniref:2TM domain-containing protein n=1 Tax=Flavobacterium frigoris TaxID=229204 RepID=A0A1H9IYM4_FLAFI|nr:2TM domain-containing protein [Flavobacterium frigoris]SEQ79703.1 2TM domain-containing protein [Flavobacterium frigoris]